MLQRLFIIVLSVFAFAKNLTLIAVTHHSCPVCQQWHKEVAPMYPDEALRSHLPYLKELDISNTENRSQANKLVGPLQYLPTFAIMDGDQLVDKFHGYSSMTEFFSELNTKLAEHNLKDAD
jgi:hypothetical protein